jgi:cytosine/adenosine deaminase-related metal-dependent hydrolase
VPGQAILLKARFASVEWLTPHLQPPKLLSDLVVAERPTLGDAIAFPGLINSHDHLAFNCYPPVGSSPYRDFLEWSRDVQAKRDLIECVERIPYDVRVQFGALKNLLWGVTAVADHGGREAPRGLPISTLRQRALHSPELEKLAKLKLLLGTDTVVAHLAEGVDETSRERALAFLRWNVFRRPIAGVHCVSLRGADFAKLAALVWCPRSNDFLFGRTADVTQARAQTHVLFGTDSTLSAPGTIWDHIRAARTHLSAEATLLSLTAEAIRFWQLPNSYSADNFVLARRRALSAMDSFFATTPSDILLVVHNGQAVVLDAVLIDGSPPPGFEPMLCGSVRKYVKMPLNDIVQAAKRSSPDFDCEALLERFCTSAS